MAVFFEEKIVSNSQKHKKINALIRENTQR